MGRANSKPRDVNPTLDYEIFGFTETGQDVNIPLSEFSKVLASEIASELGITGVPPGSVLVVSDSGDKLEQLLLSDSFEIVNENGVKTLKLVNSGCCNDSDTTKPVITLLGANSVSALQNTIYSDAGATAEDDVDGNITSAIIVGGDSVNTATPGSYIITYNVTDAAGNAADEVVRYVSVVSVDSTAPVITLAGVNPISITEGDSYLEPGAIAFDAVDGDVSSNIVVDSSGLDVNTIGSYTVTYNVSDQAGNAANEVTRTVNVVAVVIPNPIQPISLTVSLVDEVNATFNWDTAGNDPSISYLLEYMPVGDLPDWSNATSVTTSANVTTYSMLIPDSDRGVSVARVTAVNSVGDLSLPSDVESYDSRDKTAPVHGGILSVSQSSDGLAALSWQVATDNVAVVHYVLTYRLTTESASEATSTGPITTTSQALSLADGEWFFTIQAFDAAGNSSSEKTAQLTINTAVAESLTLSVSVSGATTADLSWVITPSNSSVNYVAYYKSVDIASPTTTDWSGSTTKSTNILSYALFKDLASGAYDFKVEAIDSSNNVTESNIVRESVVNPEGSVTIYYGQLDSSNYSVSDLVSDDADPNITVSLGDSANINLTQDVTAVGPESTHYIPFIGNLVTEFADLNKNVHFILIPPSHTLRSSINAGFPTDVFYPNGSGTRVYNPAGGSGSEVTFKGATYEVWELELSNPLGENLEVVIEPKSVSPITPAEL
jgi:hypothetical protein